MKRFFAGAVLSLASLTVYALTPFLVAETKVSGGSVKAAMAAAEKKLTGAGFVVAARYAPKGLENHASIIVTEAGLTSALQAMGGTAVVAIPIRVGVKSDGTVSYANPEYWGRAYLRGDYAKAEAAIKGVAEKLGTAFGSTKTMGGDVDAEKLPKYRYQFGMEQFDQRSTLNERLGSFDDAVKMVRGNLEKGVGGSAKVYEMVYPDKKLAVFGVAQNAAESSDGRWIKMVDGADRTACLPWEIFVVDKKIMALHGRFRMALCFPDLKMSTWMDVGNQPDMTYKLMEDLAGVK